MRTVGPAEWIDQEIPPVAREDRTLDLSDHYLEARLDLPVGR